MEITSINSKLLARMFLAGAKNLDSKKDWINELNVFPVPDGDTGTNMTMLTLSFALKTVIVSIGTVLYIQSDLPSIDIDADVVELSVDASTDVREVIRLPRKTPLSPIAAISFPSSWLANMTMKTISMSAPAHEFRK